MKSALTVVLFRLFTIGVCVEGYEVSVTEGDSVTLKSGATEIQTRDEIEWMFNGTLIATISRGDSGISVWVKADGSFRDRLQLDNQTGDLKISNIRTTDSGEYKPTINSPSGSPPEVAFTVKEKGVPNVLAHGGCQKRVSVDLLPNAVEAAGWYDREARSSLTPVATFGQNPCQSTEDQVAVERQFSMQCPDIASLFER